MRTKLGPPILAPGLLGRPTLVKSLTVPHRLVVISAPAGWGKTSLLAAWRAAADEHRRFAFVRLEPGDDDAPIFWTYVIEAMRTLEPQLAPDADVALGQPLVDPLRDVVPALVNDLAAVEEPIVLVLDDYHVVANQDVHDGVEHLIDHLPPTVEVVIATRADPPLSLARLRASGDLVEVRAGHLAFGEVETATFLRERFGVDLDEDVARRLCDRTEGWPAGLQLAGISLERAPDAAAFVDRFAGDDRNVADYLVGEVISGLDAERQQFLLQTSVLEELTGPLCDAVAGRSESATLLDELEHDGLFLIPLDQQRRWYRYHHLFRDWLRLELRATDHDLIAVLHGRASEWYAEHGSLDVAIGHALAIPDHDLAAELVARELGTWEQVHWPRVWRWIDRLPDDAIVRHPAVALARSRLAFETGEFGRGLQWADAAEEGLDSLSPEMRDAMATRLKLWHALAHLVDGEMASALRLAEQVAEEERANRSPDYAGAIGLAGMTTFWLVGALESIPQLTEGSSARADTGLEDGGVTPLLALAHAEVGDWSSAAATAERALAMPRADERNRYPSDMAALYALGLVAIAQGERSTGMSRIEEGLEQARAWVEPVFVAYGCLLLAEASEDFVEKRALVREARQLVTGAARRGRIGDLVDAAERKLAIRRPTEETGGSVFVEPLTDRELEVLRLLRSDLSLREIAGELFIAHNTVKSYTKSIYRKLGVTSREAALEAAIDLDLR